MLLKSSHLPFVSLTKSLLKLTLLSVFKWEALGRDVLVQDSISPISSNYTFISHLSSEKLKVAQGHSGSFIVKQIFSPMFPQSGIETLITTLG